ncbi:MAG: 2TM domain-containing protein [Rhodocyclales bacterium]|nr:2TM domain-containing protein [Rhodocyclales bacterium]
MDTNKELAVRRQVARLRGFYRHALIYVAVNAGLLLIDLLRSPGEFWVVWPLAGWGVAVAIHGLSVFFGGRLLGAEWEERKVRELMARGDK